MVRGGHVCSTYRKTQLVPDLVEAVQLPFHLGLALLPEAALLGLLEGHRRRFLQRADAREADPRVRRRDVLDQVLRADEVADAPAGGVEQLARGADGQRQRRDLRAQRRDAREGHVVQAVVDLVGEDEDVVLDAQVADGLEFVTAEDLADGVVRRVDDDHAGARRDLALELGEVDGPFARGSRLARAVGGRVQRHVDHLAAGHFDVGDVLVEEGLEDDDLVARLEEAHESREHAFVRAGGHGHFGFGVECAAEGGRVGVCDRFL